MPALRAQRKARTRGIRMPASAFREVEAIDTGG